MTTYYARMLDGATGGEGRYQFDGPENLLSLTSDEIVSWFFGQVEAEVLHAHIDWEMNAVMKNREHSVVTAIGSLIPEKNDPPLPFMLMISPQKS